MKLCSIFAVLFTFLYGISGRTTSEFDPESKEMQTYAMKAFHPLVMSNRMHLSMDIEIFCENYHPGANLIAEGDVDGEDQVRVDLPSHLLGALYARCQSIRFVTDAKPMSVEINANVVDRDSGAIIMRNKLLITNGVGALVPAFSTVSLVLFLLALLTKSY